MFYCDDCGEKKGWPDTAFIRSFGACEVCGHHTACNDVPSRYLATLPKPEKDPVSGTA